ncbi:MAG TPA: hypothetical protein VK191_02535, partial [Symbiobacteriaceae bacterium]|nr:hypothetical protein [Symbiobacteriaceae bacterium]
AVRREGGPFTLFGGEPLLLPLPELETILAWAHGEWGVAHIQTNGTLLTEAHIELFERYNVHVGISVDGPAELNDLRWKRNLAETRAATAATHRAIGLLCRTGRPPGLITTLHRVNAAPDRLPRLLEWARTLDALGVRSMRLHLLEVESAEIRERYALTEAENVGALLAFAQLQRELTGLRFDVLEEMAESLRGNDDGTSCVWHACDPYTTPAVRGVEGNGQSSNCGRTNKDGVDWLKAERTSYERYLALARAPEAEGGCGGCRFLLFCRGQCPGTAIDGDWRNRSELCGVWKELFTHLEEGMVAAGEVPLSLAPVRSALEARLVARWERGENGSVAALLLEESDSAEAEARSGSARPVASGALLAPTMPAFLRFSWAGEAQRLTWAPRLTAAREALQHLHLLTVAEGLAPLALLAVPPEEVLALHSAAARLGLHAELLPKRGREQERRLLIGTEEALSAAQQSGPTAVSGELLTDGGELDGPPAGNPFLRPLGLDLLGVHPGAPKALAEAKLALGQRAGLGEPLDWLRQILSWPLQWSSLHGIAEVKTGIFRFAHQAPYTPGLVTIKYQGGAPAPEAVRGLSFGFANPVRKA